MSTTLTLTAVTAGTKTLTAAPANATGSGRYGSATYGFSEYGGTGVMLKVKRPEDPA